MTTYTSISNALVAVGAKPFATTVQALRDNPLAIAEATSGAPVVAAGWHPYNKVTAGDANTGLIYSFAVNGAQATVTSPDFEDGYEYAFLLNHISASSGTTNTMRINMYRQTTAAYAGVQAISAATIGGSVTSTPGLSGWVEINRPRQVLRAHSLAVATCLADSSATVTPGAGIDQTLFVAHGSTAQKILRAQFSMTPNNIGSANGPCEIYMFRRRDYRA